jgi:hypothetical protein
VSVMMKDVADSRRIMNKYSTINSKNGDQDDFFSCLVVSKSFWPSLIRDEFQPPDIVMKLFYI